MADFAAVHAAEAAGFTDAEGREVVVQNKAFGRFTAGVGVEVLRLVSRREGRQGHGLRLAALEEGGSVGPGQHADFGFEFAQVVQTAPVAAFLAIENADAEGFFLQVVEGLTDGERGCLGEFRLDGGLDFAAQGADRFGAGDFTRRVESGFDAVAGHGVGDLKHAVVHRERRVFALGLGRFGGQLSLHRDELAHRFLGEIEGGFEVGLRQFVASAFDHNDFVFFADVNEVEVALFTLRVGRVDHEFAIDAADADGADRTVKRDVRNAQCSGGAVDAEHVRVVLAVGTEHDGDDLRLEEIVLREERTQRSVGHARGEDFFFGRATLAFEVAAGELSGRGRLFLVVDGQREEVLAFAQLGCGDGGDEDDGVAGAHGDGAVGEFGDFAGFEGDLVLADRARDDGM